MLCFNPLAIDLMTRQEVIQLIIEQFRFQWYLSTWAVPWTSELRKLFVHICVFCLAISSDFDVLLMGIMTKILSSIIFQISYSMSLRHSLCLSLNVFFYPGLCSLQTSKILLVFEIASYFKLTWSQAWGQWLLGKKSAQERWSPCLDSLWKAWKLHDPMGNCLLTQEKASYSSRDIQAAFSRACVLQAEWMWVFWTS